MFIDLKKSKNILKIVVCRTPNNSKNLFKKFTFMGQSFFFFKKKYFKNSLLYVTKEKKS